MIVSLVIQYAILPTVVVLVVKAGVLPAIVVIPRPAISVIQAVNQVIVQQGMREETLRGISDLGLKVIKNNP